MGMSQRVTCKYCQMWWDIPDFLKSDNICLLCKLEMDGGQVYNSQLEDLR